jgi:hypothetical protein
MVQPFIPTPRQRGRYRRRRIRKALRLYPSAFCDIQLSSCSQLLASPNTQVFAAFYFTIGRREFLNSRSYDHPRN